MRKMYELINQGTGKAVALRQAQLWLKDPDNKQEIAMLMRSCAVKGDLFSDQARGFSVESIDWQETLTDDLQNCYHWAGFMCSGAP